LQIANNCLYLCDCDGRVGRRIIHFIMGNKRIYIILDGGETMPSVAYTCLKTLCVEWKLMDHYTTIWRWLKYNDVPYDDGRVRIKQISLIKSPYNSKKIA
jgi:hypothetical protein